LVVTLWVMLTIPVSISFYDEHIGYYQFAELIITILFFLDILFHFDRAVIKNRQLITNKKEVIITYLKGWFWVDLLAAFPFYLVIGSADLWITGSWLVLFRLARMAKILRAIQTLQRLRNSNLFNPNIVRMVLLIFWILIIAHFVACGWVFIEGNHPEYTQLEQYIRALYWTITTISTVGYGDISPKNSVQMVYAMFIELIGAGLYGFIIGNIASLIANIDAARVLHRERLEKINTFMQLRNIPSDLQKRVNDYYNYLWDSRKGYDESAVLHELPTSLKTSISIHLNKEMIEKVPLFRGASASLLREIILELEPLVFTPGDYVIRKGDIGDDMFFIGKGSVDVVSEDEQVVYATLAAGQFFGEIALLLSTPRTATIKTKEYCDLYRLDKKCFERVIARYADFAEKIKELAERNMRDLEKKGGRSPIKPRDQTSS